MEKGPEAGLVPVTAQSSQGQAGLPAVGLGREGEGTSLCKVVSLSWLLPRDFQQNVCCVPGATAGWWVSSWEGEPDAPLGQVIANWSPRQL